MDVGGNAAIADRCFTPKEETGCYDRNGKMLIVGDFVKMYGCRANYGYIGKSSEKQYMVYFGVDGTSVGWYLEKGMNNEEVEKTEKP